METSRGWSKDIGVRWLYREYEIFQTSNKLYSGRYFYLLDYNLDIVKIEEGLKFIE